MNISPKINLVDKVGSVHCDIYSVNKMQKYEITKIQALTYAVYLHELHTRKKKWLEILESADQNLFPV